MSTALLILGLILFVLLVVVHEYGHFLVARKNGVEVEEFGVGFPPKIAGKTMGKGIFKAYYSVNLLPLGGFVRLKGENDADTRKGSFGAASFINKVKITMAGVVMNLVAAMVILTILALIGMPKVTDNQFTVSSDAHIVSSKTIASYVEEDSPASRAGLEPGDEITGVGGWDVSSSEDLFNATQSYAGQETEISYVRNNTSYSTFATLNESNEDQGYLGVSPADLVLQRSTWSAPIVGVGSTIQFAWLTISGIANSIWDLISFNPGEASANVAGPVGIFRLLQGATLAGISFVLFFIAIISITLGVVNALPVPALDGGRLAVMSLFKVLKKPLTPKTEQLIHGSGMAILLTLIALITIVDVRRYF